MALRFNALNDSLSSSATQDMGTFSVSMWVYQVGRTDWACPFGIWGGTTNYLYFETNNAGGNDDMLLWEDVGGDFLTFKTAYSLNQWYWLAWTKSGNSHRAWMLDPTEVFTSSTTTRTKNGTATVYLSESPWGGSEWWNGRIAAFKFWSTALSQAQMEKERWTYVPQTHSGLKFWNPLFGPASSHADKAGTSLTLDETTAGSTVEDGPPIIWTRPHQGIWVPDAVTGATNHVVSLADGITSADTLVGLLAATGSLADTFSSTETIAALRAMSGSATDGFGAADSAPALRQLIADAADTSQTSDLAAALVAYLGQLGDGLVASDTAAGQMARLAQLTDTLTVADDPVALRAQIVALADTISLAETISGETVGSHTGSLSDTSQYSETLAALCAYLGVDSDTLTLTDAVIGIAALIGSQTDTLSLSETISVSTSDVSTVLDTLGLSDAASVLQALIGAVSDTISITDSASVVAAHIVALTDSLVLTDLGTYPETVVTAIVSIMIRASTTIGSHVRHDPITATIRP